MGIGLSAAKAKLQLDIMNALKDGFKATFLLGDGEDGDIIATKFAQKASGPMSDAIFSFVQQAKIVGSNPMVATIIAPSAVTGGPCNGSLVFNGTELNLI